VSRLLLLLLSLAGCVQTTGGSLVTFSAEAAGTEEARAFTSGKGYDVTLSRAQLFIGAVYLNQSNPSNWSLETDCILPGIYSGEVRGGLTVDALSAAPQPFPVAGNGTDVPVLAGELWLHEGDIDDRDSKKVVLDVEGVASRGGTSWPFTAAFTLGQNRKEPPRDAALPGSRPICKERIVSPIPAELTLREGGTLTVIVDPRAWFVSVEFSELTGTAFIDDSAAAGQPDTALYNALRTSKGPYRFEWR